MKSDTGTDIHLDPARLPRHVAMIMDGNGRWAKKRLMNRVRGHEKGSDTVREIVTATRKLGIPYLTLYAFSTENWARPKTEVTALMSLLKRFLVSERQDMAEKEIRLNILGQIEKLPGDVRAEAEETMALTAGNRGMVLNLALSYGSREEIIMAARKLAREAAAGRLTPDDIDETMLAGQLYTGGMPDPDLIIRTSGEYRLSNFLMWQAAYAELFITDTLWPDFNAGEFHRILMDFQKRDRRFGKVTCSTSSDGSPQ